MKWLSPAAWPAWLVFLAMGGFAALFAMNSFNLLHIGMANYRYITKFGWMALMDGGFAQLIGIAVTGYLSLAFYLGFKACESELMARWRNRRAATEPKK